MNKKIWNFSDFSVGDSVSFKVTYSLKDFESFSKLSGDENPLHFDREYGTESEFKQVIVPQNHYFQIKKHAILILTYVLHMHMRLLRIH